MSASAEALVAPQTVSLDDKYLLPRGVVYLTGTQALVRLPLLQRQIDLANGLNTAGFISGYRGSPLGGYDQELWRARPHLKENHVVFQPGLNEDLAATAVWGSQQVNLYKDATYDGVFGIWYGKGPGVDRSGDVFRHGNAAGSSKHGGVLVIAGDDHAAVSSTLAHQSDHNFASWMMPVLHPATVQEFLDYGVLGFAMSRFSGCWVGFKAISETVEGSASVVIDPENYKLVTPDFDMPADGLNIRWPDDRFEQERRLHTYKVLAAREFARVNGLDRTVIDSPKPRLGIITTGKAYLDVMQALADLGIDADHAREIGLRVYKVGMPWPLEPTGARRFAEGLDQVIVVEEKRALIENQLKEQLYNWDPGVRPSIVGKYDENRNILLPADGDLNPALIARVVAERIGRFYTSSRIKDRLAFLEAKALQLRNDPAEISRTPYFCSGCPHNTSTRVPEGSRAMAGIGCHYMTIWMDRETSTFTQMGGEGVPWIGQAPFTAEKHLFANLGDGTYNHSGLLAIRASVAAGVNITYKLLYNDAVAMTGGQPVEGGLSVPTIARQVAAEGVKRIVVVTDEPEKYESGGAVAGLPAGIAVHHRRALDHVQRELRETEGCTVLIYDQTCAAEKRRRRKRGTFPDPAKRVFINEQVCEGCGDCSVKSNCLSVEPVETELGRKRRINQSTCNKDYSCVEGFCPSFVTVHGGTLAKTRAAADTDPLDGVPEPELPPAREEPYRILLAGIGGTGVVTVSALIGMAGHIEGKGVSVLDQAGLAQKGGAVLSHVQIANAREDIAAVRIAAGESDLLLGFDSVVAASADSVTRCRDGVTRALINTHKTPTMDFTLNPDADWHEDEIRRAIELAAGEDATTFIEATEIATALAGDAIATNLFLLGYAWQKGLLPLRRSSIEDAIRLNGVAVEANLKTFGWGRAAAHDIERVNRIIDPVVTPLRPRPAAKTLEEIVAFRSDYLTAYQNARYARRYRALVDKVAAAEAEKTPGRHGLAEAVARYAFKLMAYKDEYEVARLYTDGRFEEKLAAQFAGDYRIEFHLAPPILAKRDPATGAPEKRTYGPWMFKAFRVLARLKFLRATPLDPFGRTEERKTERKLIRDYEATVERLIGGLTPANHGLAVAVARIPEEIRGYGHVKDRHLAAARKKEAELLGAFRDPASAVKAAE
ncbi:indolepyruvate ferredoxin oxidoreductase family protein [Oceanibacterium hippocampi]|uniref:Indolepyruvate ferredoxin oxidoreductase n=1 Tax=Oceanibacterium hippocampi TaxID=745714 RepID=A0A1Y5S9N0_9PROT|nr:indolepyruvate ferredoxin oxidoreductase family protein [Oceanibacterium hippocampi]SLN35358.1 indolepyruvate ferredoxin oxidoreductase [Oceanibacterium hippocampi]